MASGTIERKCVKGHNKTEGRCSPRCVRWYPRIQRATPDGNRRFHYLGGYPTKAAAQAALDQALRSRSGRPSNPSTIVGGPAQPTLNDLLDHWLAHLHTNKPVRLRTIGRYRQLLAHHLRPYLGTVPLSALSTLQIQRLYDHLANHGRKDGKAGGLGPRTIRQVHLCLRQALGYAMKWHDLPVNPPPTPNHPPSPPTRGRPSPLSRSACCWPPPTTTRSHGCALSWSWPRQPVPAMANCAAWNGTTSTWTLAPSGSARPCPASTPSRPPPARPC